MSRWSLKPITGSLTLGSVRVSRTTGNSSTTPFYSRFLYFLIWLESTDTSAGSDGSEPVLEQLDKGAEIGRRSSLPDTPEVGASSRGCSKIRAESRPSHVLLSDRAARLQ